MELLDYIPEGKRNAVSKDYLMLVTGYDDRKLRIEIQKLRKDNVIINEQNAKGYYRPSTEDVASLRHYICQERSRAKNVLANISLAVKLLEDYEHERITE